MKITKIRATEVLDSRGNPTVKCQLWAGDHYGWAIVPSGASTGEFEAIELRDNDPKRYHGKGVLTAVANIHSVIAPALIGKIEVTDQTAIDNAINNTTNIKTKINAKTKIKISGKTKITIRAKINATTTTKTSIKT